MNTGLSHHQGRGIVCQFCGGWFPNHDAIARHVCPGSEPEHAPLPEAQPQDVVPAAAAAEAQPEPAAELVEFEASPPDQPELRATSRRRRSGTRATGDQG